MRSGFVTVVGRPNVGKSSLVNAMVGTKVSIISSRPNTTRLRVRGVLHRDDAQVVFVDTPGIHRPKTALGERLNNSAMMSFEDVDVIVAMVDATAAVGPVTAWCSAARSRTSPSTRSPPPSWWW